jgi:hypothetical protein
MDTYSTGNRAALPYAEQRADNPEFIRAYAADLTGTAKAYAIAADAPGLRKDAARYLFAESMRLLREAGHNIDRADDMEDIGR